MFFARLLSSREALPLSKSKKDFWGVAKAAYTLPYRAREIMFKIDFILFDAYFFS